MAKLPSLDQALDAVGALTGLGPTIGAAKGAFKIIHDLFDGEPESQEALKAKVGPAFAAANVALDELDEAIDEAKAREGDG